MSKAIYQLIPKNQSIHIVGISGTEMAAVLYYLYNKGYENITLHDNALDIEESFNMFHSFYPHSLKEKYLHVIEQYEVKTHDSYLSDIEKAATIIVPQSWFLYEDNKRLHSLKHKMVFYPDICFALFPGKIAAVTGTVGKSTTTSFLADICNGMLLGNDREIIQDLLTLERLNSDSFLIFELSNRHLANGLVKKVDVGVLTNICPNHIPDHGSLEAYSSVKHKIFDYSEKVLYNLSNPYPELGIYNSGSYTFSNKDLGFACIKNNHIEIDNKIVINIHELHFQHEHDILNILAASGTAYLLGLNIETIAEKLKDLQIKPLYRSFEYKKGHLKIINDGASCLPENTKMVIKNINEPFILITGGSRQVPRKEEFYGLVDEIIKNTYLIKVIILGPIRKLLSRVLVEKEYNNFILEDSLKECVINSLQYNFSTLVFSPGCGVGNEYTDKYERGEHFDAIIKEVI